MSDEIPEGNQMVAPLTKYQIERIKGRFLDYKYKNITLKDIGNGLGLDCTTIGKRFAEFFGEEYSKISKKKSYKHSIKLSDEEIYAIFGKYKQGKPLKELAFEAGINHRSITARMSRLIGDEYRLTAKKRRVEDFSKIRQKVSNSKIKEAFEKYKVNKISLTALGNELGLAESSLIFRFKRLFGKEYRKIALKRRDERKISKEDYIKAFQQYTNTKISLTDLANKLNVRLSSIRPRFLNLFGEKYIKVAKSKLDGSTLNHRGELAEYLALEYLKSSGINIKDVRGKAILKNTLKRPDFVIGNTFIEIKSNFIKFSYTRKRLKGYEDIISDYYGKETKDGTILKNGMIISLSGFSERVWKQAKDDGITLIDHKKLLRRFEEENRTDLLEMLEDFKGIN